MASMTLLTTSTPRPNPPREERGLDHRAFSQLLAWLDQGVDSGGDAYLEMRRRLVSYFVRKNRRAPDELADETFNRISWILQKDGTIPTTPPARYCYAVAKFVFLEDVRRQRAHVSLDESRTADVQDWRVAPAEPGEGSAIREQRLDCLDRCLQELKAEQRELIVEFYRDTSQRRIDRRRDIARRLGITTNALSIRAYRIRSVLEERVRACCGDFDRRI